jgi:DNA-binding NarL/FixJ family response regulator
MASLRVLLIEDNYIFREVLRDYLRKQFSFMIVEEASNCVEALQKIHKIPPHLIFMDMHLPEMNALKLTQKIKKESPHIHIAIITSYDLLPEFQEAARQSGADRLFRKDLLRWEELENFIESVSLSPEHAPT